jgi:hypothetical protein
MSVVDWMFTSWLLIGWRWVRLRIEKNVLEKV